MQTPCSPEAIVVESVRFPSGPHRLEGELAYPEAATPAGAVVLAGPQPLLGGSMHNNVVRALGDGLAHRGLATLRFNYRGVGGSEGPTVGLKSQLLAFLERSHVPEEQEFGHDLRAAIDFLRLQVGGVPLALVGYSFGCSLLPGAIPAGPRVDLVLVAPTVGRHDLDAFTEVLHPKLVIAPRGDFAADEGQLLAWFDRLPGPKELLRPEWDGHFFRQQEAALLEVVASFLTRA